MLKNFQILPHSELHMLAGVLVWQEMDSNTTPKSEYRVQYNQVILCVYLWLQSPIKYNIYTYQKEALHNDIKTNSAGRLNGPKCVCTKQESQKVNEAETDGARRRNSKVHNIVEAFNTPSQQVIELLERKSAYRRSE